MSFLTSNGLRTQTSLSCQIQSSSRVVNTFSKLGLQKIGDFRTQVRFPNRNKSLSFVTHSRLFDHAELHLKTASFGTTDRIVVVDDLFVEYQKLEDLCCIGRNHHGVVTNYNVQCDASQKHGDDLILTVMYQSSISIRYVPKVDGMSWRRRSCELFNCFHRACRLQQSEYLDLCWLLISMDAVQTSE